MNSVLEKGEKQLLKVESKNGNMEIGNGNGNGKWNQTALGTNCEWTSPNKT